MLVNFSSNNQIAWNLVWAIYRACWIWKYISRDFRPYICTDISIYLKYPQNVFLLKVCLEKSNKLKFVLDLIQTVFFVSMTLTVIFYYSRYAEISENNENSQKNCDKGHQKLLSFGKVFQ